jgi:hypothetical protein
MRILIESSDYSLLNLGDVVMVDIAVARLRALWPQAMVEMFSDTPELVSFDVSKNRILGHRD